MPEVTANTSAQAILHPRGEGVLLTLTGRWRVTESHPNWAETLGEATPRRVEVAPLDVESWDSSLLLFLVDAARWCRHHQATFDASRLPQSMRSLLDQLSAAEVKETVEEHATGFAEAVGNASLNLLKATRDIAHFVGECTLSALFLLRQPHKFRWRDCLSEMQQCGAMSLPIVSLVSFLVGVTLAYTAAVILRQFGADIWVADLVGLSMAREMAAVMTGVVLAGRTGAAFAAHLGNMKANEEVDALVTLGVSPVDFLVMPRLVALGLMMPLLALYSMGLGIIGGMVVAQGVLSIPPSAYWIEMLTIVDLSDVLVGEIKAGTFGLIVGFSGCLCGLQADRSAAGVGRAATSAVVTSILLIVIADALYAVVFNLLGL